MNWSDHQSYIEIVPPPEFSYKECFVYLDRSKQENLHQIHNERLIKLISIDGTPILLIISFVELMIRVDFPLGIPSAHARSAVASYVWDLFDLDTNLSQFYEQAVQDSILQPLVNRYYGLRIVQISDLFEALTWAIMGQQINLTFAYTLKSRFVERFGESLTFGDDVYWLFPTYDRIAQLNIDELREMQFTSRKAEYVIGVAKEMCSGNLSRESLLAMKDPKLIHQALTSIRGIGAWTADYVMMKCLHNTSAFPITDVGLHNALKLQLEMDRKPTLDEIKQYAAHWDGWQAYATFYLWRSLL
ncbi:DNA-3-methyladenine glycosylase 2 family protein [Paenibacillus albiflavus]|uniref:DNA-3-methyladenine glycosylase II n=1 Tax=Paenibacillus albiflavus TaxID=2545760 RepID=A0A4R4EMP5_9BACL|nr:DNA glycosylase [Paenibacillus albiflavus]TCZ81127.1 DNA-3-methyladenine glycosylase 2 family protein [Paenibacillus albiflavus]